MVETYVVDTHALAWFIGDDKRLSSRVEQILDRAEVGEVQVLIPTLVLAELTHLAQRRRIAVTIEDLLNQIRKGNGFTVVAFDFAIFQMMLTLPNDWDIHDRIIAATARFYQVVLMTRDDVLRGYADLETVCD
jgi:PIN domain nuclease of toxin-antitoxin system